MPSWAPNTATVIDKGFGSNRNGAAVTGIVIHHVAGTNGRDYVANWNSRGSHPTYHIAKDGTVTGIVHPDRQPWSSGAIDRNAVTVEIDNTAAREPWPVSDAALESVAKIIAHHAAESSRSGIALNRAGTMREFWVEYHNRIASNGTACPGPYVIGKIPSIIERANELYEGEDMPLSSEDVKRIAAESTRQVWGRVFKAINEDKEYGMPEESAAMRLRRASDRSGRAMVLGRMNSAENKAILAAVSTLADSQGLDGEAIVQAVRDAADKALSNFSITLTAEGDEDE